jgi:hypothetical protein
MCAGKQIVVCWEEDCCVLGRRLMCIRKHIDECRETNWCVLGSRLMCRRRLVCTGHQTVV